MKPENQSKRPLATITEDQQRELANLVIELDALHRIFEHASCEKSPSQEITSRVYRDVAALLLPLCVRLDRFQRSITR